ncbi:uncharacterized protein LOC144634353 [Oculina patagonica]
MALRSLDVCIVVFVVIAIQAVYSCGPVALERKTSDDLESNAALNSAKPNEELSRPAHASDASTPASAKGMKKHGNGLKEAMLLPLKHHKEHQEHKRNHKPKKHHGKRHHHHHKHHHQHHHRPASAKINLPNPSPAFPLYVGTVEPLDLLSEYAQINPAPSVDNQLVSTQVFRYAGADKAPDDSQIKIAKIGGLNPSPTPTITPLSKLVTTSFQPNQSVSERPTKTSEEVDPCTFWQNCDLNQGVNATHWLQELPSCPCQIQPLQLIYNNTMYDQALNKFFQWRELRVNKKDILRRTAEFCIRSLSSTRFTAQVCCYDSMLKLITRGIAAGTPFLVSPDWSREAHFKVDILPVLICNGDWTRYHAVRPPNNGRNCTENPDDAEFALQEMKARDY